VTCINISRLALLEEKHINLPLSLEKNCNSHILIKELVGVTGCGVGEEEADFPCFMRV